VIELSHEEASNFCFRVVDLGGICVAAGESK